MIASKVHKGNAYEFWKKTDNNIELGVKRRTLRSVDFGAIGEGVCGTGPLAKANAVLLGMPGAFHASQRHTTLPSGRSRPVIP